MKILLSIFIFSMFSLASGADVNCNATGMWRPSGTQLLLLCDGVEGVASGDAVAKSITVKVKRTVLKDGKEAIEEAPFTLTNLPSPAIKYYENPKHPDILAALGKIEGALVRGDKLEFDTEKVIFDDATVLYEAVEGVQKLGTIAELKKNKVDVPDKVTCDYGFMGADGKIDAKPKISLISAEFCTGKKICVAKATCIEGGVGKAKVLTCAAVGDECPDATDCLNDKKVIISTTK